MVTQAVFFDLDGTLIDTAPDMGGALNRVLEKHNKPPVSAETYRAHVSHGSIALLRLGFSDLDARDDIEQLRENFLNEYEQNICTDSHVYHEMEPVLAALEQQNIPWGIITNKPEYLTLQLLEQLHLTQRSCCIVGADTAARPKPHPDPMLLACSLTRVDAKNCIYVGDAERDIQAGVSVDMVSLIAGWGYIDPEKDQPQRWGAHDYLERPTEILDHLALTNAN